MKLASRVKKMADGFEREIAVLGKFLVEGGASDKDIARIKFMVRQGVIAKAASRLRELETADKAIILANLKSWLDEMQHEMEDAATLAEGVKETNEHDYVMHDTTAREYLRLMPQVATLQTLDKDDR